MTTYRGGFRPGDLVVFEGMSGKVADGTFRDIHPMHVPVVFEGKGSIHHLHYCDLTRPEPQAAQIGGGFSLSGVWQPTGEKFEVMFRISDTAGSFYIRERQE